jgi:transposase
MSLRPQDLDPVPTETAEVAWAAFPKGHAYLTLRDKFGTLFSDELFRKLFAWRGQPAEAPGRLALVTVLQFAEGLSDRQAADAVRSRLDWKYLLALELKDPGFDASVLSEFRSRLVAGGAEQRLFETVLAQMGQAGLLKQRGGRARTDATHVLAAVRTLHRLECVGETLRQVLEVLAVAAPEWLRAPVPAEWFERYGQRFEDYRLPDSRAARTELAETIGADGFQLLAWVYAPTAPAWLREIPAVDVLRQVWLQQFYAAPLGEPVRWRAADDLPPSAQLICTPYDVQARYSQKRQTIWTGYKVHLTETCDADGPHLITDVQTTLAPAADVDQLPKIQADLAGRGLLPAEQLVDAAYVSSQQVLASRQTHGIDLVGPMPGNQSWQARAQQGYATPDFALDWTAQQARCPHGHTSVKWTTTRNRHGQPVVVVRFDQATCRACPARAMCVRSVDNPRRLSLRPQTEHEALLAARARQLTPDFQTLYATRAGIEGTLSQAVRNSGLRRSRYLGLAKTHLQHLLTATATNLLRAAAWLMGRPFARTRRTAFAKLALTLAPA